MTHLRIVLFFGKSDLNSFAVMCKEKKEVASALWAG